MDLVRHDHCATWRYWDNYTRDKRESAVLIPSPDHLSPMNATARNRYRYSLKSGYQSRVISWGERSNYLDDIYAINTSLSERQGRPMGPDYVNYPLPYSDSQQCHCHYSLFLGCIKDDHLVGYISGSFCGELSAASQILGHADHLASGCMLNLWVKFVEESYQRGIKAVVYSRWSDGTDGLKYWKYSVGLKPMML